VLLIEIALCLGSSVQKAHPMTSIEITRSAAVADHVTSAVMSVYRAIDRVQDWNDARVTRKALSRLTARELDDIGLCRDDIARVAERRVNR